MFVCEGVVVGPVICGFLLTWFDLRIATLLPPISFIATAVLYSFTPKGPARFNKFVKGKSIFFFSSLVLPLFNICNLSHSLFEISLKFLLILYFGSITQRLVASNPLSAFITIFRHAALALPFLGIILLQVHRLKVLLPAFFATQILNDRPQTGNAANKMNLALFDH
jgi:hypothetical protein